MTNIVIFGAPGSGKGTQSDRLIEHYGFHHISTGDVLRDHIKRGTELGKVAEGYIKQGQLIPDELMIDILGSVLDDNAEAASKGVIFDGFPRTIPQAQALSEMMKKRGSDIHAVVGLEVEDDELVDRLLKRGQMSGRSDDNLETINQRLKVYHSQTSPLREYYLKEGKYNAIQGMGSIDDIFESIKKVVDAVK